MHSDFIPVCRPLLPPADEVAAYIRSIDARRYYTNRGPLVCTLEQRLAGLMGLPEHAVRSAASGTAALEVAILATAGPADPDRPLALLPSFTFAATALVAERCGYVPHFVDIDRDRWTLDAEALARHPLIGRAGLVLGVAPYGRLPDMRGLERLRETAGVPVVVDAAAATEQVLDRPEAVSSTVPLTLSFHATKTFSTGEGGAVLWNDAAGQERIVQVSNFGFWEGREAETAGTNAKLSEYHAAVGLAMLDGFAERRRAYAGVTALYRAAARGLGAAGRLHLPPEISAAYALFEAATPELAGRVERTLSARQIETRRWYEAGVHVQPRFASHGRDPLPVTADLSARLLGLPMAPDLSQPEIARVFDAIGTATTPTLRVSA